MSRRSTALAGLVAVAALTLAACSGTDSTTAAPTAQTRAEDELVLAVGDVGEGEFDPLRGWGNHQEHKVLHSSLVQWNRSAETGEMELVGDLARDFSHKGTVWTFHLREDFMFSDGEPVTAADVVFTYDLLKEDGTQFDLTNVAEVRAVDERTVEIELVQPDSLFGPQAATIAILPEHAYGEGYSQNPIASGPYRVVEYQDGEQLIMEANPHYPEELTYRKLTFYLADEEAALSAAQAGTVDVAKVSYTNADRQFEGMTLEQLESVETMAITLPTEPAGGTAETMGIEGPGGNDVTSDPAVRKALSLGVDRRELNDIVVAGYGEPAYSVADTLPWGTEDVRFADADPEGAKKLLADAGWIDTNGDGTVDKDGVEAVVGLMYTTSDSARADLAESFAAQAAELGIRFEPEGATWDDIYAEGKSKAVVFALGSLSPKELWDTYSSESVGVSYNNMPNYSDPEVDEHLTRARLADTLGGSIPEWQAAQAAGASSHPETGDVSMLWILRRDHLYLINDRVDIGEQITHGHGHGMQIFQNVTQWR